MGTQQIVERILSDARAEAETIIAEAQAQAAKLYADAETQAAELRAETEKETKEKCVGILEKRAADARLDGAKIWLSEKRKVINAVYDEAHSRLLELSKEDCLAMFSALLENYAEKGDEICLDVAFPYAEALKTLPVVQEKALKVSQDRVRLEGGMFLKGEKADKDLSYPALLAADRDEYQAELARELFK